MNYNFTENCCVWENKDWQITKMAYLCYLPERRPTCQKHDGILTEGHGLREELDMIFHLLEGLCFCLFLF